MAFSRQLFLQKTFVVYVQLPSQKSKPRSNRELTMKNNQKQARFNREKPKKNPLKMLKISQ